MCSSSRSAASDTIVNALQSRLADLMLLGVAAVWGTSYGFAKEALSFYPVLGFLALRFALTAGCLLWPLVRELKRGAWPLLRSGVPLGAVLLVIFLCETFGVVHTTAANAAVLISLCVVITPFIEWAVFGERPGWLTVAMVGLSACGVWLLTDGVAIRFNLGDGLILVAALMRAVMVVSTRKLTRRYTGSTLALTALQAVVVAVGCAVLAVALLPVDALAPSTSPRFWLITVYLVLFCTVFAFFAQNFAVRRTTATRASLLMGSEPLFGALFAVFWFGESLSQRGWFGVALIVTATLCVALRGGAPDSTEKAVPERTVSAAKA